MERATNKRLTVTGRYDGTCIVIEFQDNGCGFVEETRAALINHLNNQPLQNIKMTGGMSQIKMLLAPYKPVFNITSIPGDTTVSIRLPV